ncbi:hypothetical protein ACFY04_28075 [Streptomyces sp. NPDC001549]|uniref:hypothetical protein n=1 Tax=Streptomyces sp. NPDC001549 TaxID=3364586 RepID=UPI0036AA7339
MPLAFEAAVRMHSDAALAFGVAPARASSGYDIWCNGYHANCGTFYYNSNLSGYTYLESGKAGYGKPVKNNARLLLQRQHAEGHRLPQQRLRRRL